MTNVVCRMLVNDKRSLWYSRIGEFLRSVWGILEKGNFVWWWIGSGCWTDQPHSRVRGQWHLLLWQLRVSVYLFTVHTCGRPRTHYYEINDVLYWDLTFNLLYMYLRARDCNLLDFHLLPYTDLPVS